MLQITDKAKCTGCTACRNICPKQCIQMQADEEGFLYPHIAEQDCIECGLCERTCPVLNGVEEQEVPQKAFLFQNGDEQILKESTSGGAFTAFAQQVLAQGGVVFGAAFDENFVVKHRSVESVEELWRFRNSKYVQSEIGSTFQEALAFLKQGRLVLFSGTPCQIEGLHACLKKPYSNLILMDVVCHAVPSPLVWNKYKNLKISSTEEISGAWFRSKEVYGYQYSQIVLKTLQGGFKHAGVESDPYLRAFFSNLSDRPSCYECMFKKRYRVSDLTIWDCFDVYKFDKSFDDNRGVTRILTHTPAGERLVLNVANGHRVKEIPAEQAVYKVKELIHSVPMNPKREQFFADARQMQPSLFFAKWFPKTVRVRAESIVRSVGMKLGVFPMMKRIAKKILNK